MDLANGNTPPALTLTPTLLLLLDGEIIDRLDTLATLLISLLLLLTLPLVFLFDGELLPPLLILVCRIAAAAEFLMPATSECERP